MAKRRARDRDRVRIPTWMIVMLFAAGMVTNVAAFAMFLGLR